MQIAFFSPAKMMERVCIRTRLIHATERNLVVEGLMLDEKAGQLKAVLWMQFTYIDLTTGRPSRHTDELMQLSLSVRVEGFGPGFDLRANDLRAQFRNNGRQKEPSQLPPAHFASEMDEPQLRL